MDIVKINIYKFINLKIIITNKIKLQEQWMVLLLFLKFDYNIMNDNDLHHHTSLHDLLRDWLLSLARMWFLIMHLLAQPLLCILGDIMSLSLFNCKKRKRNNNHNNIQTQLKNKYGRWNNNYNWIFQKWNTTPTISVQRTHKHNDNNSQRKMEQCVDSNYIQTTFGIPTMNRNNVEWNSTFIPTTITITSKPQTLATTTSTSKPQ